MPTFATYEIAALDAGKQRARRSLARNAKNTVDASDVGYLLDVLQGRLLQVAGAGVSMRRQDGGITLGAGGVFSFRTGAPQLSDSAANSLAQIATVLVEYRKLLIVVRTNSRVPGDLGARRGVTVAQALADAGVERRRIVIALDGAASEPELQLSPIVAGGSD